MKKHLPSSRVFVAFALILLGLSAPGVLVSQNPFPEPGPVFRDDLLPVIKLYLPADSMNRLLQNPLSDHEYPARFEFVSGTVKESLPVVGLRIRGNTSRLSAKKSFKISFNTFTDKGKFFELEKMNLNGEHNDPSVIRSKLGWDLYRSIGVPAPRANHILLYINDKFHGVYINVEHIDEEFVKLRYGNKKGNLYKCLYPADLTFRSKDPNDYKFEENSRRSYELQTNELADDYSDLSKLIDVLNNTPTANLYSELSKILNINSVLGAFVIDVFIGNWDGPFYNKNNFYLYKNTTTGLFEFIPYDLDNTFGIDWFGIDWVTRPVYAWSPAAQPRPLYTRILEVPALRREYTRIFHNFLDKMAAGSLFTTINRLKALYGPYIATDPYYPLDYGWKPADFQTSFNDRLTSAHVKTGIIPFIYDRSASARSQLDAVSADGSTTAAAPVRIYPNPVADFLIIEQDQGDASYQIISQTGALMLEGRLNPGHSRIDLTHLSPGIYYLQAGRSNATGISTRLLVVR